MNVPLLLAGLLAMTAAAVHGIGGQLLVLRRLWEQPLPSTRFGGAGMTKAMLLVAWHITTFAFLAVGVGMVLAATALDGDAADALAWFGAAAFTGFAGLAVGLGASHNRPRALMRHPGPAALAVTAALAWWGAL